MEDVEDELGSSEANKICGVCGDRALGYNFNAISCESCKAFFRRNALKNKEFRCPFTENCNITPVTRKFCQKCRLNKCFSIGMKKEYIMSDEDKVLKRQKIEQNRAKKRSSKDNCKITKMKKESRDESKFDGTTSIASAVSVASVLPDSCFWESDKNYTDLDVNQQSTVESLSPIAAASVPSPSSPPQDCDIAGSKTLEMLKESSNDSISNFTQQKRFGLYNVLDVNVDNDSPHQLNPLDNSKSNIVSDGQSIKITDSTVTESTSTVYFSESLPSLTNCLDLINNPPVNNGCKQAVEECKSDAHMNEYLSSNDIVETIPIAPQLCTDRALVCQKPKGNRMNEPELATKLMQNPGLVARLMTNPNVIARIIQDQNIFAKLIADPEILSKLVSDPEVSQYLEDEIVSLTVEETIQINPRGEENTINGLFSDVDKNEINGSDSQLENPILTNLITNSRGEEQNRKSDATALGNWNEVADDDVTKDTPKDLQRISVPANSIETILCEVIKLEFSIHSNFGGKRCSKELNDAERAKLNELTVANKALLAPLDDDITNLIGEECKFKTNPNQSDPALLDVINLTAVAIRRLIKMAKKINAFKNMCQEDQLALLKGGCTEMMMLRSAINYDPDKETWQIPRSQERISEISVDILKEAEGNLYAEHAKFVRTFDPRWRDENIILLLCAIALFSPDRPRVVHRDVIKLEQNSYYYLLKRYLESVYPGCEAKSTFLKLIQKISELHQLNEEVVGVYLNVNPSNVEPLLIEIFDLKH